LPCFNPQVGGKDSGYAERNQVVTRS
jgi:hypothetical protein